MKAGSAEQFSAQYGRVLNSSLHISSNAGQDAFAHDISVDDLIIRDVEQTLRLDVENRCQQWQKVDSEYLVGTRAKGGFPTRWAPKGHLAIPHGLLMTGIQPTTDLSHPRIPENVKDEYLSKVLSLFRDVPRARALLKSHDASKPLRLKQLKMSIDRDHEGSSGTFFLPAELNICGEEFRTIERPPCFLSSIPPASEFAKGVREVGGMLPSSQMPRAVQNGEVVLSFSLYGKSSSSLPKSQRMQDVDVLGSQTLRQLRDSFTCRGVRGQTTEERSHSGSGHEYAYFLIETTFYATDAVCAVNSSENVSDSSSTPSDVRSVKDWLLNQHADSATDIPTRGRGHQPSVNPCDSATHTGSQVGVSTNIVSDIVTDDTAESTNGLRRSNGTSRASKRVRSTKSSSHQLGGGDTDDGDFPSQIIPSTSATIADDSSGSQGAGNVAALISATEIVSSTVRLVRRNGNSRKKKGPTAAKRSFADNWVIDDSDDCDNDVSVNNSSRAAAIPFASVTEIPSTTSIRREPKKKTRSARTAADPIGDSQEATSTRSRLGSAASHPEDRVQTLLDVHGLPPSSTLDVLSLDVSVGSLALRAGVRYLYRHGADSSCDCEHFLYLTDMHMHMQCCGSSSSSSSGVAVNSTSSRNVFPLFQFQDRPLLRSYPRQTFSAKAMAKKCGVCLLWSARYVVQGDRLADKSPMLYCQHCYFMMHYSPSGELIYDDFTVMQHEHLDSEVP